MKTKNFINSQKGAAAVEAAIVIPLLALMAFGAIEFGLLFYNKQVIVNASREGARAGIVQPGASNYKTTAEIIKDVIKPYCYEHLIDFGGNSSLNDADIAFEHVTDIERNNVAFGTDFKVIITYKYKYLVPALFGLGPTKTITHAAVMKMEQKL